MRTIKNEGDKIIIRQTPLLLLVVAGILSFPCIMTGLILLVGQSDPESGVASLIIGLGFGWLLFEFVAKREEIIIDTASQELWRHEKGLFRTKHQHVHLRLIDKVVFEKRRDSGKARYRILLQGPTAEYLINNPSIVYLDHHKMAEIISETTRLPLETVKQPGY